MRGRCQQVVEHLRLTKASHPLPCRCHWVTPTSWAQTTTTTLPDPNSFRHPMEPAMWRTPAQRSTPAGGPATWFLRTYSCYSVRARDCAVTYPCPSPKDNAVYTGTANDSQTVELARVDDLYATYSTQGVMNNNILNCTVPLYQPIYLRLGPRVVTFFCA